MTILNQHEPMSTEAGPSSRRAAQQDASAGGDDPLRRKRHELLQQQAQLHDVQRVMGHLQRVQSGGQSEALVPFGEAAFVKARGGNSATTPTALVDATSEYARLAPSQSHAVDGKVAVSISVLLPRLAAQQQQYEKDVASLREEVMRLAQHSFAQQLEEAAGGATEQHDAGETGQALNEEGLPFVDLTEPVVEDGTAAGKGVVVPFEPKLRQTKEERKAWMESVLAQLEQEEQGGDEVVAINEADEAAPPPAPANKPTRPTHTRLPSSERPLPIKSVLKHTPLPQRFGASGMRKGFLNMNPSSPAAEHSSDPIEQIRFGRIDDAMSNSTSSLGSMAEHLNGGGGDVERMSRSTELASPQAKKKKKTVRIQSPESERRRQRPSASARDQLMEPLKALPKDEEDYAMDEAQGIVKLLGIDAIKGHPQYDALKKEYSEDAPPPIPTNSTTKRKLPHGPSVKKDVVERGAGSSSGAPPPSSAPAAAKSTSAFKRGFLNVKPKLPSAPRASQGISALERATNNDEALSEQRAKQGLPPSVPHARPSKAFAAKIEASKRGEAVEDEADNELPARMSKVRFGEEPGAVAVRVGTAASQARDVEMDDGGGGSGGNSDDDDDDKLAAMGLDVYDEELDEEQVDALGYFSDEGEDPDIGFDSDDLVDAAPHFDSDASDILNDDLRAEYERMKASLTRKGTFDPRNLNAQDGDGDDDDDEDDDFASGRDLSMADGDEQSGQANVSRFRRERLHRAMMGKRAVSRELGGGGGGDSSIVNAGPSMLIPALANVRFPKPNDDGSIPTAAHEIELDGVSDEEEERLENVMRARMAQRDFVDEQPTSAPQTQPSRSTNEPPRVLTAASPSATTDDAKAAPAKKTSLFKARMRGNALDE